MEGQKVGKKCKFRGYLQHCRKGEAKNRVSVTIPPAICLSSPVPVGISLIIFILVKGWPQRITIENNIR